MSKFLLLIFFTVFVIKVSSAQTTYTWAGGVTGDYQDQTNWTPARTTPAGTDILAFNNTVDIVVANVPNQTIGAIKILSGTNSVTFKTNVITNILTVTAATPLIFNTAGSVLVGDLLTVRLSNTGAFTINSGTFGIAPSSGGKIIINSSITLAGGTLDFDVAGTGGTTISTPGSIK